MPRRRTLRSLQVDDEFKLPGEQHRQVNRFVRARTGEGRKRDAAVVDSFQAAQGTLSMERSGFSTASVIAAGPASSGMSGLAGSGLDGRPANRGGVEFCT
jgi:hypothetical protein